MKVILYMAITANGMIGKPDGNSDFTSEADGESFNAICQKNRNNNLWQKNLRSTLPKIYAP